MKKLLLFCLLACYVSSFAQQQNVSGIVSDNSGPLPGVSILIKGSSRGYVTDFDGKYNLKANKGDVLIFTFIGMKTQEITVSDDTIINVVLVDDSESLQEIVVTSMGIKKTQKSLGYAQSEVKGGNLTMAKETDVVTSIAGKVAGVQILGGPGSSFRNASVRVRGVNSLRGGTAAFVVDGTFVDSSDDINMDDVETLSVLRGPAAVSLYGSRGSNGIILITTKSGKRGDIGFGVSINQNTTFDQVALLPEYQNEYAGGSSQTKRRYVNAEGQDWNKERDKDKKQYEVLYYGADESWGPKIDGRMYRPWYSWYKGTEEYGKEVPLEAHPNNVKDFFDTGISTNTNISLSKNSEKYLARISYTNVYTKGIIPNSKMYKNYLTTRLKYNLSDEFSAEVSFTYKKNQYYGRPAEGYSPGRRQNVMQAFNQWFQRQLDVSKLRDYRNKDGSLRTWNVKSANDPAPMYWNSPYYDLYENVPTDDTNSYYGFAKLAYEFNDNFEVSGTVRKNYVKNIFERKVSSGGLKQDFFSRGIAYRNEENYEFLLSYDDKFMNGDITVSANFGGQIRIQERQWLYTATNGGLAFPNLFHISASRDRPGTDSFISERQINGLYATANIGYKDFIFVDFSLRNDWSSTLPKENNSYMYPSINTSFIFSDLLSDPIRDVISFGKLRAAWGKVGTDVAPYEVSMSYVTEGIYEGNSKLRLPSTLPNSNLKPALSSSLEFGIDLKFFNDRFGIDFGWYQNDNVDQILSLEIPPTSGFNSVLTNAGNIRTSGIELTTYWIPIKTNNFSWEMNITAAQSNTDIISLAEGQDAIQLSRAYWGRAYLYATVGKKWGNIKGKMFTRNDEGRIIVNDNGVPMTEDNKDVGQMLPDFTGGLVNTFTFFKNFTLKASIDFQKGGLFYSITNTYVQSSGLAAITTRDGIREHGIVVNGVTEDGKENTKRVDAKYYFKALRSIAEHHAYDASYVKFRELSLAYKLPDSFVENLHLQGAQVAFVMRNVGLLYSNSLGLDPSEIEKDWSGTDGIPAWQEGGQNPGVRSYGFNIKFNF